MEKLPAFAIGRSRFSRFASAGVYLTLTAGLDLLAAKSAALSACFDTAPG
jgi:hypothetical protein